MNSIRGLVIISTLFDTWTQLPQLNCHRLWPLQWPNGGLLELRTHISDPEWNGRLEKRSPGQYLLDQTSRDLPSVNQENHPINYAKDNHSATSGIRPEIGI